MRGPNLPPARKPIPARLFPLGEEPGDDLSSSTTPEQRFEMVAELTRRMWELTGKAWPSYTRADMPGRVIRRADLADIEAHGEDPGEARP